MEIKSVCATGQEGEGAQEYDVMFGGVFFCHLVVFGGLVLLAVGSQYSGGCFEHEDEVERQ